MSGETLFTALYSISTIKTKISYGDVRYCLPYTDQNVSDSSHLYGLYDGASLVPGWDQGTTWNREHVWPQSKLGESGSLASSTTDARSDLHNLRACTISSNSAKGDDYFDEKDSTIANTFYPNYGDTNTDHRGDVARICFYMYLMYRDSNGLVLSDNPSSGASTTYGILSTMIKWNTEDPVDDFEIQRNNRVEEYQGNRNPFIDHPEYADRLFN